MRPGTLIRFRPNNTPHTAFTSENTFPRLRRIIQWNDANGDFEIALDLFFHFTRPVPVRESKTAMDLRLRRVFGCEEIVEIFFGFDHTRVCVAKLLRALI